MSRSSSITPMMNHPGEKFLVAFILFNSFILVPSLHVYSIIGDSNISTLRCIENTLIYIVISMITQFALFLSIPMIVALCIVYSNEIAHRLFQAILYSSICIFIVSFLHHPYYIAALFTIAMTPSLVKHFNTESSL